MIEKLLTWLLLVYSAVGLLKFILLLTMSYDRRRKALDSAYQRSSRPTARTDDLVLLFAISLACLLAARGAEPLSFLAGLLIGMTLIQLYFHRFSVPLYPDRAPPEPRSPLKWMSYAIQAAPARAWKEMTVVVILILWSAFLLLGGR